MQNLSELMHRLISSQVEFVLVGGFAAAAHGVTWSRSMWTFAAGSARRI
jgi:hypothetical protein